MAGPRDKGAGHNDPESGDRELSDRHQGGGKKREGEILGCLRSEVGLSCVNTGLYEFRIVFMTLTKRVVNTLLYSPGIFFSCL